MKSKEIKFNGIGSRLKTAINSLGVTQKEFSTVCGFSQNSITNWMNEKFNISPTNIQIILSKYPQISRHYLFFGEGLPLAKMPQDINKEQPIDKTIPETHFVSTTLQHEKGQQTMDQNTVNRFLDIISKNNEIILETVAALRHCQKKMDDLERSSPRIAGLPSPAPTSSVRGSG